MNKEIKTDWLDELAKFIVEANKNTYAAGTGHVSPQRPGCDELEYRRGPWLLHDSYAGDLRAPGTTMVSYKNTPCWAQSYGGLGMKEEFYGTEKTIIGFLKKALMKVSPDLPLRGPREFSEGKLTYQFNIVGNLENCSWEEYIFQKDRLTFSQIGFASIIIYQTADKKPLYPWNF